MNSKQLTQKKSADSYKDNYGDRNWNFVKLVKSLTDMEELRKFQSSTFETTARRKLIEDQNTILELSSRVQELQNEVNCMNETKNFKDAESVHSGNSTLPVDQCHSHLLRYRIGMSRHSFVSPRRKEGPASIWDTHGKSGNVFANPPASSSAPYPQELNQWNSSTEEPRHMSTAGRPTTTADFGSSL